MRILQIVENLDKGAVENWLVRIFLKSRKFRPDWKWTFYCILAREGRLDDQVRAAGGEIIYAAHPISEKLKFWKQLRQILRDGHFDIVHAHHDYLCGYYLTTTRGLHFRKRIVHVHNTDKALPVGNKLFHDMLLGPLRALALTHADLVLGISKDTLAQFQKGWAPGKTRFGLLYYGIDMEAFRGLEPDPKLRKSLDIPEKAKLLLHVGRMIPLKNPVFIVDILASMLKQHAEVYALFVGKGLDEITVMLRATELGIEDHVRLLGWRDDIPRIMKTADLFVFPRLEEPKEGLGLVVVEAQTAGLPILVSKGIVDDAIEIPELARVVSLSENAYHWAGAAWDLLNDDQGQLRKASFERMHASKFELSTATRNLIGIYES